VFIIHLARLTGIKQIIELIQQRSKSFIRVNETAEIFLYFKLQFVFHFFLTAC